MSTKPPEHYDDPFGLDYGDDEETPPVFEPAPIPTGLSDEDDAARYLAQRFNGDLAFCPNCEVTYDFNRVGNFCPRCKDTLRDVGTPPRRRKFL
jgi:hypothetical protein